MYYRARYYDPELGRFITSDPIGFWGGINFYAYCLNNPVNWVDPETMEITLLLHAPDEYPGYWDPITNPGGYI